MIVFASSIYSLCCKIRYSPRTLQNGRRSAPAAIRVPSALSLPLPPPPVQQLRGIQLPGIRAETNDRFVPGAPEGDRGAQDTGIDAEGVAAVADDAETNAYQSVLPNR